MSIEIKKKKKLSEDNIELHSTSCARLQINSAVSMCIQIYYSMRFGVKYPFYYLSVSGKKPRSKAPKIQRLITPVVLQRKRRRLAMKIKRSVKRREEEAQYHKMMTQYAKVCQCWRNFRLSGVLIAHCD